MGERNRPTAAELNRLGRAALANAGSTRRYSLDQLLHVLRMGARYEQYRWWLLDGDLEIVSDGKVAGASLPAALADLSREIDRLGDRGQHPTNQPYRLIVYKGAAVVAVRPATLGIC